MIPLFVSVLWLIPAQSDPAAPASRAAATSPDVMGERLDEPIAELTLKSCTLADAIARLSQVSGTTIAIDDAVGDHLPYGLSTKLANLTVRNASLRETLPKILMPLALAHRQEGAQLRIVCTPALGRMDERATWVELKLLSDLASAPYTPESLEKISFNFRITSKVSSPASLLSEQMAQAGRGTMAQLLESATASLGWAWYPDEGTVIVLTRQAAIARQMALKVKGTFVRRHIGEALFELGSQAGVHVYLQPNALKVLPPHVVDSFTLPFENMSVRQAFDYVAATTGLAYRIEVDGVYIGAAEDLTKTATEAATAADDPYVAKLSVPIQGGAGAYEFLIRQSEMPADVQALRRKVLREFLAGQRQPSPASRSAATQPASPR